MSRPGLAVVAADAVAALRLLPALEAAEQCCTIIGCALAGLAFSPASRLGGHISKPQASCDLDTVCLVLAERISAYDYAAPTSLLGGACVGIACCEQCFVAEAALITARRLGVGDELFLQTRGFDLGFG